jgi:2-oxoglutarate ferredoxin oxidoreductase subunit beta
VTHNKVNSYEFYRKNIFAVENEPGYNPKDKNKAWEALQHPEKIATGLIYEEEKPAFEDLVLPDKDTPIAFNDLAPERASLEKIMEKFR